MTNSTFKRSLALILALALIVAMVPQLNLAAFASGELATYKVNGVTYTDFTEAMTAASASSKKIVTVATSGSLPAGNLTVPAGVILLIPCKDDDNGYNVRTDGMLFNHDGAGSSGSSGLGPNAYCHAELTVPAGTTLTVYGTVLINSVSGRTGGTDCDIVGGYGQINLNGSINIQKGGLVDCFGFIKGTGRVNVRNGATLGDLYIVRNWRGGSQAMEMYTVGVYPMNEYDCHNVETTVVVEYGGSLVGLVKMYGNGQYNYTRFPQVDVKNGLIRSSVGGYVVRTFKDGVETYKLYGGADFASSTLSAMGVTLSTDSFLYPIDGDIKFELNNGSYNFKNDYKVLPGASVKVASDAELTVDEKTNLVFYDEFNDVANNGTEYPERPAAKLIVEEDGRFTNNGIFSGIIDTESVEIFIGKNPVWELKTREANGPAGSSDKSYVEMQHNVEINYPGKTWSFNKSKAVVWEGLADYTKVQQAIADIPKDLEIYYEAESVTNLRDLIDSIDYEMPASEQAKVDALATPIKNATKKLVAKTVTIYLDAQGGTIHPDFIKINAYGTFGKLPTPTRDCYRFAGWYDEAGDRVRNTTPIRTTEPMTLYATWNLNDADYDALEDAEAAVPKDLSIYTTESVAALNAALAKINWRLTADKQHLVDEMEQNIWNAISALELKKVTVTLDPNGGVLENTTVQATYSKTIGKLPVPTREGYSFIGWKNDAGVSVTAATAVKTLDNISLVAQWKENPAQPADYTAVYEALDTVPEDMSVYTDASAATVYDAIDAIDYTLTEADQASVDEMAAYLKRTIASLEYIKTTLLFNANGGKVKPTSTQVTFGTAVGELPTPTRSGYDFMGWYAFDGTPYTAETVIDAFGTLALKASWQEMAKADYTQVKETINSIPNDLSIYTAASAKALESAVDDVDWELTIDKQGEVDAMNRAIKVAIAGLTIRSITITFDANGGTVSVTSKQVTCGDVIGTLPVPTNGESIFLGWSMPSGRTASESTIIASVNDMTLVAIWGVEEEEEDPIVPEPTLPEDTEPTDPSDPVVIPADYAAVDAAIAAVPADLSVYTDETAAAVIEAVNAVVRDLTSEFQAEVDAMAKAINDAVAALVLKPVPADYSAVSDALASVPADLSIYTDETAAAVTAAVNAVVRDLTADRQAEVDAMAKAIRDAVAALVLKPVPADYAAVDAAIAAIPADLSVYTDESVAAVNAAVNAVIRDLTDDRQAEVDAMAKAIDDAIAALVLKIVVGPANYAAVDAAIAAIPADLTVYTDESVAAVNAAVNAVIRDLTDDRQAEVDAMAKAIDDAVAALVLKIVVGPANYAAVDAAIAAIPADLSVYTDESVAAVNAAVNAVIRDLTDDRQAEVDAMAKAIDDAVAALVLKIVVGPADYAAVDAAIAAIPADLSVYTDESVAAVNAAVNAVIRDLTEDRQAEVDAMAKSINDAVAALERKEVLYTSNEAGVITNVDVNIPESSKTIEVYLEDISVGKTVETSTHININPNHKSIGVYISTNETDNSGNVVCMYNEDGTLTVLREIIPDGNTFYMNVGTDCQLVLLNKSIEFTDVAGYWSTDELDRGLNFLTSRSIIAGKTADTFVPGENIQRRTVALVLWRMAGSPEVPLDTQLTDKDTLGKTYLMAVCWAEDTGIITGYADGTFRGEKELERRHFALMLYRFVNYMEVKLKGETVKDLSQFPDSGNIGAASWEACQWAVDNGIINGRGNGAFDAQGTTTRAQMAIILYRFLQKYYPATLEIAE